MNMKRMISLACGMAMAAGAQAGAFVNGGFEDGDTTGWTVGTAVRNGNLSTLLPGAYLNGATGRSAVMSSGTDPYLGALMPNVVYSGSHSYRVEDVFSGGYLSVISQTVTNYTDPNIFFVWMAVLEGAHSAEQAAGMKIELVDLTTNETVISRIYSAEFSAVDNRFKSASTSGGQMYYTDAWQVEQLTIDRTRQGHDFRLTVLATDCDPTAHLGYVYLDGFGAVNPPTGNVPEPASLALLGAALAAGAAARRRRSAA